jgi:hypothetical protein
MLEVLAQHDAFNDALMTAMMYVVLRDLKETGCAHRTRPDERCFQSDGRMKLE